MKQMIYVVHVYSVLFMFIAVFVLMGCVASKLTISPETIVKAMNSNGGVR